MGSAIDGEEIDQGSGGDPGLRRPRRSEAELHNVVEWRDGRISFIHDYRYVRYVTADAELTLAAEAKSADDGATQ